MEVVEEEDEDEDDNYSERGDRDSIEDPSGVCSGATTNIEHTDSTAPDVTNLRAAVGLLELAAPEDRRVRSMLALTFPEDVSSEPPPSEGAAQVDDATFDERPWWERSSGTRHGQPKEEDVYGTSDQDAVTAGTPSDLRVNVRAITDNHVLDDPAFQELLSEAPVQVCQESSDTIADVTAGCSPNRSAGQGSSVQPQPSRDAEIEAIIEECEAEERANQVIHERSRGQESSDAIADVTAGCSPRRSAGQGSSVQSQPSRHDIPDELEGLVLDLEELNRTDLPTQTTAEELLRQASETQKERLRRLRILDSLSSSLFTEDDYLCVFCRCEEVQVRILECGHCHSCLDCFKKYIEPVRPPRCLVCKRKSKSYDFR